MVIKIHSAERVVEERMHRCLLGVLVVFGGWLSRCRCQMSTRMRGRLDGLTRLVDSVCS